MSFCPERMAPILMQILENSSVYFIYEAESYKIANFWFLLTHKNGIFIWLRQ